MKISTKGRYAVRLMIDLATYNTGLPVSLKDIAKRQEVSEKYLEQIIATLNKAGYVRGIRGAQGGYMLTKDPKDYTVGMILRLTEGDMKPVACLASDAAPCNRRDTCVTIRLWEKLDEAISGVIDNITVADLLLWKDELSDQYSI